MTSLAVSKRGLNNVCPFFCLKSVVWSEGRHGTVCLLRFSALPQIEVRRARYEELGKYGWPINLFDTWVGLVIIKSRKKT